MAGKIKHTIDPKELETLYQTRTAKQLAEHYGCGESTIWSRLKQHDIKHHIHGTHRHRPREFSVEHRARMSAARKGKYGAEANGNWQGGKTLANLKLRASTEYRVWRQAALALRGGKCQQCKSEEGQTCECCGTKVKLHVHHVLSFAKHPQSRFDPENSEVLCPKCHWSRHSGKIG